MNKIRMTKEEMTLNKDPNNKGGKDADIDPNENSEKDM